MKFSEIEFDKYATEAKEKWGNTKAYHQYEEKTKDFSKDKWNIQADEMDAIFAEFAECLKNRASSSSDIAQGLVKKLQNHITENFYNCTDEILAGLAQMYVSDERFRDNIDRHGEGTAEFIRTAIAYFCYK